MVAPTRSATTASQSDLGDGSYSFRAQVSDPAGNVSYTSAISVVVDRMIPSSVKKLRSLLFRNESRATAAASKKEALDFTRFA